MAPTSVTAVFTCPVPAVCAMFVWPDANQRPAARPLRAPTVSRSANPSPVKSWSAWIVAGGVALNVTVAVSPTLPPADRLVTLRTLVNLVGLTAMLGVPDGAGMM